MIKVVPGRSPLCNERNETEAREITCLEVKRVYSLLTNIPFENGKGDNNIFNRD